MTPYYSDESVTIYHGDCRELVGGIARQGWDEDPMVIVTDPPYGIAWRKSLNRRAGSRAHAGIVNDQDTSVRDAVLAAMSDTPAVVFGSFYAPFPANVKQVLVWQKPADAGLVGSTTGYRRDAEPIFLVGPWPIRTVRWSSVLRTLAGQAGTVTETGHPHTKPTALMEWLIDRAPSGTVLDPFMGSGSTLVAAKSLGRKAIGIEIEEHYCAVAARRLSQEVLGLSA